MTTVVTDEVGATDDLEDRLLSADWFCIIRLRVGGFPIFHSISLSQE